MGRELTTDGEKIGNVTGLLFYGSIMTTLGLIAGISETILTNILFKVLTSLGLIVIGTFLILLAAERALKLLKGIR